MHDGIAPPDQLQNFLHYIEDGRPRSKAERQNICVEICEDAQTRQSALISLAADYLARAEGLQCAHQHLAYASELQEGAAVALYKANESGSSRDLLLADMIIAVFARAVMRSQEPSERVLQMQETLEETESSDLRAYLSTAIITCNGCVHNAVYQYTQSIETMRTCLSNISNGVDEDFDIERFNPAEDDIWLENPNLALGDFVN